jgi:large subunit ribosomal protein L22
MEYRASHRFADMTPRKIRQFADLVRGRSLDEALQLLRFVPNRGARLLESVLLSARGNAMDKGARDVEDLTVSEARVDGAPSFKRIMPRARGTAYMIKRRMAHIHIALSDDEDTTVEAPKGVGAAAEPAGSPAPEVTGGTPADVKPQS